MPEENDLSILPDEDRLQIGQEIDSDTSKLSGVFFKIHVEAIPKKDIIEFTKGSLPEGITENSLGKMLFFGNRSLTEENRFDYLVIDGDTREHFFPNRKAIVEVIINTVLNAYPAVTRDVFVAAGGKFKKGGGKSQLTEARLMAARLGRQYTKMSYPEIASLMFEKIHHTSAMRFCRSWKERAEVSASFYSRYEDLEGTVLGTLMEMFPDD